MLLLALNFENHGERSLSDDIKTDILIVGNCPAQVSVKSDSTNESKEQKI